MSQILETYYIHTLLTSKSQLILIFDNLDFFKKS